MSSFQESSPLSKDHFIEKNGMCYAGMHLIIDLWEAVHLDNLEIMKNALHECVIACKATLLHLHLHQFEPNGGISGIAILAESHISIHSWPEKKYAAIDLFMCGNSQPFLSLPILKKIFQPKYISLNEQMRGILND
ncbi:adenosylmethionine decarboxylase [Candidatus Rhabdochlamydia porcellionis]|jgi:S-adenosylmethionine decarboxylase|uniref:S-adenosylmethionine decarboxylase proenzyme n=1 Tax=Candidatus Rhabdochlamydia porcellionis TaxID=225148 RepID=A0ABX8YYB4_9BACT|nr:adenosylmethionine decarboxylase [Candidatus Rhabdochlamydia porcellionis]QZA58291.1 S-adenosylmethionine decarboxylase proenzyme [Candidatus Rhabdochlamydia porcellionis]